MKALVAAALLASAATLPAWAANVSVTDAWARATMPGQKVSGAYMQLQSDADARLVSASSPAVPRVEIIAAWRCLSSMRSCDLLSARQRPKVTNQVCSRPGW